MRELRQRGEEKEGIVKSPNLFWSKVEVKESGCWEWQGAVNNRGYGVVQREGRVLLAHRLSFEFYFGLHPAPFRLHKCDNRKCVRPDHLFPGNQSMNMLDCKSKGRNKYPAPRRGEEGTMTKLSEGDVLRIRELSSAGIPQQKIADKFCVSQAAVWYIIHRRNWAHLL